MLHCTWSSVQNRCVDFWYKVREDDSRPYSPPPPLLHLLSSLLVLQSCCDLTHRLRFVPQVIDSCSTEVLQVTLLSVSGLDNSNLLDQWAVNFERHLHPGSVHDISQHKRSVNSSSPNTKQDTGKERGVRLGGVGIRDDGDHRAREDTVWMSAREHGLAQLLRVVVDKKGFIDVIDDRLAVFGVKERSRKRRRGSRNCGTRKGDLIREGVGWCGGRGWCCYYVRGVYKERMKYRRLEDKSNLLFSSTRAPKLTFTSFSSQGPATAVKCSGDMLRQTRGSGREHVA